MNDLKKRKRKKKELRTDLTKERLDHLVLLFMPMAISAGWRYTGSGAEQTDLTQTGVLGLYYYIPQYDGDYEDLEALRKFLLRRLPGYVRHEARKWWRWHGTADSERVEEIPDEEGFAYERKKAELKERVCKALDEEELQFVRARLKGLTQREIAQEKGVAQSTVSEMQQSVRKKLHSILRPAA